MKLLEQLQARRSLPGVVLARECKVSSSPHCVACIQPLIRTGAQFLLPLDL